MIDENNHKQLEQEYDKYIQDSIDAQNFFSELLSSDVEIQNTELLNLLETEDKLKIFNILESFNYASLWNPSQVSRIEDIFDFIYPIINKKAVISNEQLKYEIFTSQILRKKIIAKLSSMQLNNIKDVKNDENPDRKIFEIIRKDNFVDFQDIVSQFDIDLDGSIVIPKTFEYREFFHFEFNDDFHKSEYENDDLSNEQDDDYLYDYKNKQNMNRYIYKGKLIEIAIFFGSINIFKFLWMNKVNIDSHINKYLIAGGNYEIIHLLEDYIKYTPEDLAYAVQFHKNAIYDYLMDNNDFKFNVKDIKIAVRSNNLEFLVTNMPEIKESQYISKNIDTILRLLSKSIENKNVMIFIFLFTQCLHDLEKYEKFSYISLLKEAIKEKSFEIVRFLINLQNKIGSKDIFINDLQSGDLIKGTGEMMKYIILNFGEKSFNIDAALMCKASSNSVVEVVELIDSKYNHFNNTEFEDNESPFHCACLAGNFEVVKYLADMHKEWIEMKDNNGIFPIHDAVLSSKLKVVKYLVNVMNVDINTVDDENRTPLYYAIDNGYVDIVEFLCSLKNVNINVKTNTGATALELAINKKNQDIINILMKKGGIQNIFSNI